MRLEFKGMCGCGDAYRVHDDAEHGAFFVGEANVVDEVMEYGGENLSVYVNGELIASGRSFAEIGWGYSEYTPMESDVWSLEGESVIEKLEAFSGRVIHLVITNEPAEVAK